MTTSIQPDPAAIGGVAKPPFAVLPDPATLFAARAARFHFLGQTGNLAPYLAFLAALAETQAALAAELAEPDPVPEARIDQARAARMPPLDRTALASDPAFMEVLSGFAERMAGADMPGAARIALDAVRQAGTGDRGWLIANVLAQSVPEDSVAPHLFAAAAVEVAMAARAARLEAGKLVPIGAGLCPSCGGRPATSMVTERMGAEGVRYACCATCATQWNEVRVKCLCCGSTKGISYRSVEDDNAVVKAEVCAECRSWVKILYQNRNTSLDPIADDVASLGLDALMRDTEFRRGGFNPLLQGV